jgi:hypothetical protein
MKRRHKYYSLGRLLASSPRASLCPPLHTITDTFGFWALLVSSKMILHSETYSKGSLTSASFLQGVGHC